MGRQAEHVHTDHLAIAQMEALVRQLPTNGHVRLHLHDAPACEGIISERPNVQLFYDGNGNEGFNGVVHLERLNDPAASIFVWLDRITTVEHLDSTMGSES